MNGLYILSCLCYKSLGLAIQIQILIVGEYATARRYGSIVINETLTTLLSLNINDDSPLMIFTIGYIIRSLSISFANFCSYIHTFPRGSNWFLIPSLAVLISSSWYSSARSFILFWCWKMLRFADYIKKSLVQKSLFNTVVCSYIWLLQNSI